MITIMMILMILITNIIVHRKTLSTESNTKLFKTDKHVALFLYFLSLIHLSIYLINYVFVYSQECLC